MIALAKMVITFCDGSDNLKDVEDRLNKVKEALEKMEK